VPGPHIAGVYLTLLGSDSSRGHCSALGHSKVVRTKERDPIQAGQQGASDRYPAAAHIHQTHLHPFRPRRAASRFRTRTEAPPTYLRVKQAPSCFSTLARVQCAGGSGHRESREHRERDQLGGSHAEHRPDAVGPTARAPREGSVGLEARVPNDLLSLSRFQNYRRKFSFCTEDIT